MDPLRLVLCVRPDCQQLFFLCRVCDRSQCYCSRARGPRASGHARTVWPAARAEAHPGLDTLAGERAWGADAPHFGQLVKLFGAINPGMGRYAPPKIVDAIPTVVYGQPDPEYISTSYVERQNLTIRMACRRFTRLTNAFSKKLDNLKAALALHFAWYNFVRIHRTLRITPSMAAGVTDRVWELDDLMSA